VRLTISSTPGGASSSQPASRFIRRWYSVSVSLRSDSWAWTSSVGRLIVATRARKSASVGMSGKQITGSMPAGTGHFAGVGSEPLENSLVIPSSSSPPATTASSDVNSAAVSACTLTPSCRPATATGTRASPTRCSRSVTRSTSVSGLAGAVILQRQHAPADHLVRGGRPEPHRVGRVGVPALLDDVHGLAERAGTVRLHRRLNPGVRVGVGRRGHHGVAGPVVDLVDAQADDRRAALRAAHAGGARCRITYDAPAAAPAT
jgi:hypothetical protein